MKRVAAVVLIAGALTLVMGCAGQLPRPAIERSPVGATHEYRLYIPVALQPRNVLGVAGCGNDLRALGASWCYSWGPQPGCGPGGEYVPMIWDETQIYNQIGGCSEWLMGWNEPDHPGQANISVAEAVKLWPTLETRAAELSLRLVAPAPSQRNPDWLAQFRREFIAAHGRAPVMAALACHCYRNTAAGCITETERYLAWADAWGVPEVWVTEVFFSQECEQRAFMAWVATQPRVTRVAPFVARLDCQAEAQYWDCAAGSDPSLFDAAGRLTEYGRMWARPMLEQ